MTIIDNDVARTAVRDHGRQIIALAGAAALLWWVHLAPVGPARFAAVVGATLLILVSVLLPRIDTWHQPRPVMPPPAPDNPSDEYGYLAYLEGLILDTRAEMDERDETIDTMLAGLQSSASGVAYTTGRLRRRLDRTISHTS